MTRQWLLIACPLWFVPCGFSPGGTSLLDKGMAALYNIREGVFSMVEEPKYCFLNFVFMGGLVLRHSRVFCKKSLRLIGYSGGREHQRGKKTDTLSYYYIPPPLVQAGFCSSALDERVFFSCPLSLRGTQ